VLHWDFLVEAGNVLRAWRLYDEPAAHRVIAAERNADHRLMVIGALFPGGIRANATGCWKPPSVSNWS
jgi:hypothetical protein